jgi:hypothetical protein
MATCSVLPRFSQVNESLNEGLTRSKLVGATAFILSNKNDGNVDAEKKILQSTGSTA